MASIWKDYYFSIPLVSANFRVRLNDGEGDIIYEGRAEARPDKDSCRVKVNGICSDYIREHLPVVGRAYDASLFTMTFRLEYEEDDEWTSAGSVTFDWDWSGESSKKPSTITNGVNPFMYLVRTAASSPSISVKLADGTSVTPTATLHNPSTFSSESTPARIFCQSPAGAYALDLTAYPTMVKVTINGQTFEKKCGSHALYYLNEYGDWDFLLLEGRSSKMDDYDRVNINTEYDNTSVLNAGERTSINGIKTKYTLRTGWVSTGGASNMHHLLGSPLVYLQDLSTGEIVPVIIDNTECEYKDSRAGVINYDITMHRATTKIRK